MRAKGISHIEHLRALYTKDLPGLWGEGHVGPANLPLPRYQPGDFPVAERLKQCVVASPGWIDAADGAIAQFADAVKKVVEGRQKLL